MRFRGRGVGRRGALRVLAPTAALLCLATSPPQPAKARIGLPHHAGFGSLDLAFEPNLGQAGVNTRFTATGGGFAIALASTQLAVTTTQGSTRVAFVGA